MVKARENLVGAYAFLVGVVLAVIFGIFNSSLEQAGGVCYSALVLIGLVVGFTIVGDRDSNTFLLASLALVIVGALGHDPLNVAPNNFMVTALREILVSLLVLFVPATIIVALKTVFAMAKI